MKFSFFSKHGVLVILVGILLIGTYLRFRYLKQWMWEMSSYDESRDVLVAKHIVEYGDVIWRGPLVNGGQNILMNSPFYYYFLAILWSITRSADGMVVIIASLMVLMIYFAYKIGSQLWDSTTGLFIALLVAVHPQLVLLSEQISQPYLLLPWIMIVLIILTRKSTITLLTLFYSLVIIFLSLHIHYGAFIIIPSIYLWLLFKWFKSKKKLPTLFSILLPVITTEYLFFLYLAFTYKLSLFDQIYFFERNLASSQALYWRIVLNSVEMMSSFVWYEMNWLPREILTILVLVFLLFHFFKREYSRTFRINGFWLCGAIIIAIVLSGFYHGKVFDTYFISLLPIVLILLGVAIRIIYNKNKVFGLLLMTALSWYFLSHSLLLKPYAKISYYKEHGKIAEAIAQDYGDLQQSKLADIVIRPDERPPSFILATLSADPSLVYDGWGTGSTWYWLEYIFHQKLVKLTNTSVNFVPLVGKPRYFYVICDHSYDDASAGICLGRFTRERTYISNTYETIYHSQRYTVWRFIILSSPPSSGYNVVYKELLNVSNK